MSTVVDLLHKRFFTGSRAYAEGSVDASGKVEYFPVEASPTPTLVRKHLSGEMIMGAYTLRPDSSVLWMAFDVDSTDLQKSKEITLALTKELEDIPHGIEFSGKKGYHILIFFDKGVPAAKAKQFGENIRDKLQVPKTGETHIEVFPKQAELANSGSFGNLLKLPLGVHPQTGRRSIFVNPTDNWENGNPIDPIEILSRTVDFNQIENFIGVKVNPIEGIVEAISPYWNPGQRHDLALGLAGWMAHADWPEEDVLTVIELINNQAGGDLANQLQCVTDTYKKLENGGEIRGFTSIANILPNEIVRQLSEFIEKKQLTPIKAQIRKVRLEKGALHEKSDTVIKLLLDFLKKEGKLFRDIETEEIHWLDGITNNLYTLGTFVWDALLYNMFSVNIAENFGRTVAKGLYFSALDQATETKLYSRSYWDGEKLWINLGNNYNYILNGTSIGQNIPWTKIVPNGEEGVVFKNKSANIKLDLKYSVENNTKIVDPWKFLVEDLNFGLASTGMSPDEQKELLKAWILSTFFPNLMPTRPILTIIANPGSGKTSAARRILKILEGPHADVIGINTEKPDSLRTTITSHNFVVLDNLERTKAHWLTDLLNRVATGTHIELRKLYSTNEIQRYIPNCYIIITAVSLPFSEESLYTRLLPLELATLRNPIAESVLQSRIDDNFDGIWLGLLVYLQDVVRQLKNTTNISLENQSRLADFNYFCNRIQNINSAIIDTEILKEAQNKLVGQQKTLLRHNSPLASILEIWIFDEIERGKEQNRPLGIKNMMWHTATELNYILHKVAVANSMEWPWTSGQALSKHIQMLENHLARDFGLETKSSRNKNIPKRYRFVPTIADDIEDYDLDLEKLTVQDRLIEYQEKIRNNRNGEQSDNEITDNPDNESAEETLSDYLSKKSDNDSWKID